MREESSDIKEDLPMRLKIFEKFPERPLMTSLSKIPSDYSTPKVRDSFVSRFVYETENNEEGEESISPEESIVPRSAWSNPTNLRYRKRNQVSAVEVLARIIRYCR